MARRSLTCQSSIKTSNLSSRMSMAFISLLSKLSSKGSSSDVPRERAIQVGNLSYSMSMLSVSLTGKTSLKLLLSSKTAKILLRRGTSDLTIRNAVLRCKSTECRLVLDKRLRRTVSLSPVRVNLATSGLVGITLSEISLFLGFNFRSLSVSLRGTRRSLRQSRSVFRDLSRLS